MFTNSQIIALKDIAEFMIESTDSIHCLSGSPGTGKSYLIQYALPKLVPYDMDYIVCATTNKASALLNASTVHKVFNLTLKNDYRTGQTVLNTAKAKHIRNAFIVIDEASMIDIELWKIITQYTHNCKILLVGDSYQLPAVKMSADVFNKYPVSELTEVVRQRDPEFLNEIAKAKEGVIAKEMYNPQECDSIKIVSLKDKNQIKELLREFTPEDKVLCYTNDAAIAYALQVRKLKNKDENFVVGDPVLSRNYCESVTGTDTVYCEQELTIASLSEIKTITKDNYSLKVREVTFNEVIGTFIYAVNSDEYKAILKESARLKDWTSYFYFKEKILDMRNHEACTIHCSQGSTYNRTFIDMADIRKCRANSIKARLLYVALSRAKNEVYIYDSER